jgi:hypothetical protein
MSSLAQRVPAELFVNFNAEVWLHKSRGLVLFKSDLVCFIVFFMVCLLYVPEKFVISFNGDKYHTVYHALQGLTYRALVIIAKSMGGYKSSCDGDAWGY